MPSGCVERWPIPHWVMPIYHVEWACWSNRELTLAANWIYPHTQWSSDHQMVNISTPLWWWSNIFGLISELFLFGWQSEILAGLIKLVPANQDTWQIVLNSLFIQLLVSLSKLNIIEQKLIKPSSGNNSCLNQLNSNNSSVKYRKQ